MDGQRRRLNLFSLEADWKGAPHELAVADLPSLGVREVQDLERWIKCEPGLLGEPLKIVASQFAGFEGTQDRLDLLAIDRRGKLVVVEIKRDGTASSQDLQGLRYAAYAATLEGSHVVELYREYEKREHGRVLTSAEAHDELDGFADQSEFGGIDALDDDARPRVLLVATGFPIGVTSTVLWLRENSELDITCVQIVPYEIEHRLVLASTVLIPLPEAEAFQTRMREKQRRSKSGSSGAPVDFAAARAFVESIPAGRWASYGDVAAAAGSPRAAQSIGNWLAQAKGDQLPSHVYRVLKKKGVVSPGWSATEPGLPVTQNDVIERLRDEGVAVDEAGRASQDDRWRFDDWLATGDDD